MRTLLLLRGSAGCGKSTWIEQNGLKPYTLSADDIRLMCRSPELLTDGGVGISQSSDKFVWQTLFKVLETRMQNGEFTVIDATNSKTSEMNRYKDMCQTYRYRIYCVDFTDIPIEEVKRRNANRAPYKRVPETVIDNMYARFATQKIPSGIKVIKPNELDQIWTKMIDLSEYKMVHHIGDIHGCYTALQDYLTNCGGIKDDNFYIFTGDYIDRGIENVEVLKFLYTIKDKPNVLLLEGNHEKWLQVYGHEGISRSKEFELITKRQLEQAEFDKKEIRQLYRKFAQCAYYKYGDKVFLVTHGGLSDIPPNLTYVATSQMIKGVGGYNMLEDVYEAFMKQTPENCYQIHGHRNIKNHPIKVNDRIYNLEGQIEFGGHLRCVQVSKDGISCIETKNEVFKSIEERKVEEEFKNSSMSEVITKLRNNQYIQEKNFGNISSFNFTQKAFYGRVWDEQTTTARGLYIDITNGKICARGYRKFFNINERPETKFDMLQYKLQFPVTAYVKENGFLGLVSYNEYEDDLLIATKSNIGGDYAQWLKEALYSCTTEEIREEMKKFVKENNVTFVFECIDMIHDPHIIDYSTNRLVLLDVIYNNMEFQKYEYDDLLKVARRFNLIPKTKACVIDSWQEFYDWYYKVLEEDYEYDNQKIEGFVIEDSAGYMTKLKLTYYNFWKFMRGIAYKTIRYGRIKKTSCLTTPVANEFYSWIKNLVETGEENIPQNICELRRRFFKSKEDAQKE